MSSQQTPANGEPSRPPRVFLIAQPTIKGNGAMPDTSDLGRYGTVHVLVRTGELPFRDPVKVLDLMEERLADFDPDIDYMVWVGGDTLSAVMAGYMLRAYDVRRVKWLRWSRPPNPERPSERLAGRYVPATIDFEDPQLPLELDDPDETEEQE